ncbi:MAG: phosphoribosylformylglycinamidine synthase subunit PurS [Solirubrobacterales bacterium]
MSSPSNAPGNGPVNGPVKAQVLIRPKAGILDPQGQAVESALPALGFSGVAHVHVGRLVELEVDDPSQLDQMCQQLLSNPLIEDYEIRIESARSASDVTAGDVTASDVTASAAGTEG